MKKYILLLLIISSVAMCDDLYLRNGFAFRNIKVIDSLDRYVRIQLVPYSTRRFAFGSVEKIVPIPFDSLLESGYERWEEFTALTPTQKPNEPVIRKRGAKYEYPNLKLIPVTVISFALAIDYFTEASDIQSSIDKLKESIPNGDYSSVESQKSRKQLIGGVCVAAGIINLIFSLERVEIRTDGQQLSLSYTF
ncbi:MAG: hypothetical protein Q8L88_02330 [Bacteroidota bacterium]|nr:hypothetical protein [Bacteroidota bacterium]